MSVEKVSRLKVGVDVPWVTSWTAEAIGPVRRCPTVGGRLAISQQQRAGFGRPLYSQNHLLRQRQSIVQMLCPMCGTPTARDDRWLGTAKRLCAGELRGAAVDLPADVHDDQVVVDAGSIAPLHRTCAERSARRCPHLKAEGRGRLVRFPKRRVLIPLIVEATDADTERTTPVIGFIQLCGITDTLDRRWRASAAA